MSIYSVENDKINFTLYLSLKFIYYNNINTYLFKHESLFVYFLKPISIFYQQ